MDRRSSPLLRTWRVGSANDHRPGGSIGEERRENCCSLQQPERRLGKPGISRRFWNFPLHLLGSARRDRDPRRVLDTGSEAHASE